MGFGIIVLDGVGMTVVRSHDDDHRVGTVQSTVILGFNQKSSRTYRPSLDDVPATCWSLDL